MGLNSTGNSTVRAPVAAASATQHIGRSVWRSVATSVTTAPAAAAKTALLLSRGTTAGQRRHLFSAGEPQLGTDGTCFQQGNHSWAKTAL
eukprot:6033869-Pleurochrysis_carterae.AAC.1